MKVHIVTIDKCPVKAFRDEEKAMEYYEWLTATYTKLWEDVPAHQDPMP